MDILIEWSTINFELKELFLLDFNNAVEMDDVPEELVIKWDQTGINYVPISSWTMEQEGESRGNWKR